jgi:heme-degrading monooxygenase HmoA
MITLINVFTVHPDKQQDAFQAVQTVYMKAVRQQPGFISAQVLKSDDGRCVTAIAHWEREADLQAMKATPAFKNLHDQKFYDAIISNDVHVYSTVIDIEN